MVPRRLAPLAALLAAFAVVGCNSDAAKGEAALARLQSAKAPGFLRIVNLTSEAAKATRKDGASLYGEIAPGEASTLLPMSVKSSSVLLNGRATPVELKSGEGTAVIALPEGKTELVTGLVRRPTEKANVWVAFAKGDGSSASTAGLTAESGGTKTPLDPKTPPLQLPEGECRVLDQSIKIEPKSAYTFLFVPFKGKLRTFLMLNTPSDKPVGSGASG